jgi:CRP/FNR family cyclic AMP-dependent transcriptional regulator
VSIQVLKRFRVFKGLNDSELSKLVELCRERTFGKGAFCFHQGKRAMELHLCRSGKVDIVVELSQPSGVVEVTVHTVEPWEVFGWSAVVEPHVYTGSAKCTERTEDICIKGSDLTALFERNPRMGYVIMRNLSSAVSSRLADTRRNLSELIATARSGE